MTEQKAVPRKVQGLAENQIIVLTFHDGNRLRRIEIDAVKQWSNSVKVGVRADPDIKISDPINIDHSTQVNSIGRVEN